MQRHKGYCCIITLEMIIDKLKRALPARGPKNTHQKHVLALDIGTEFVKALIAVQEGDNLIIVGAGRARQDQGDMHSGAIADIAGVVRHCEAALAEAEDQAGLQATRAVIGIAGELVKGSTDIIKYKRPQPDRALDAAEMEFIIEKVQEKAHDNAQKQIAWETGNDDVEIRLVNSAIVGIHIDGYKISNPIGFQGRDVAIQIYTAFAPMVHIGALERTAGELDLDLLAVAAEPFAVSRSVLGTDASSSFTAILADIGGGTTDIAVVNDGGVEGTRSFGIGGRSFTRTIAADMGLSYQDSEKLKINIDDPDIKDDVRQAAEAAVDKTLEVWLDGIELALGEFDSVDHLPNRLLLCGGGASLRQLVTALEERDWYKGLPFTRRPEVRYIQPDQVLGVSDSTGTVRDHTYVTATGLLRVGYDTMINSSGTDKIKDKLNRFLRV